ncbi:2-phospho-L-lactate guanylyltransferase [Demequina lignilytica]|uniref:Phosphoenolpyruvate guanylyltransferase n=1 Tax=Demequina lignilytica TaxID=3051663 RepID=A0AAW7M0R6_9MICO|nr:MULTISPECIES: 2-phospho-L-lactate guanylyltransferase [unclassified Demequina]MDN4479193.1 2-phospho-L-lactate guanylyltransferase [Demequina sp. SYSU T00039-1]MDN4484419.1 2-phospho-L-lactate guanylyltransferase [Demequina sp. SYSU T0a273]MDN4487948.1 2-phospho-L-lactate guanylyltransferase [Demequina sp. SYSU T00039]MDN4491754.1 2-phospho-L-lactate guanylyltransferase [Demequina sp. SYSU T00068]
MTGWTVLIPVKGGPHAKSRLPEVVRGASRAALATALAADTVAAVVGAADVARVIVVTETPGLELPGMDGVERWVQHAEGLNAGISEVARMLIGPCAVVLGDLPALRPADVDEALARVALARRAVFPDAAGTGTTLLGAIDGRLLPAFGQGSFARHRALGYQGLDASLRLSADVDTERDLDRAHSLGLGAHTVAALAAVPVVSAG